MRPSTLAATEASASVGRRGKRQPNAVAGPATEERGLCEDAAVRAHGRWVRSAARRLDPRRNDAQHPRRALDALVRGSLRLQRVQAVIADAMHEKPVLFFTAEPKLLHRFPDSGEI